MNSIDSANIFLCGNVWSLINGASQAQNTYERRKVQSTFIIFSEVQGIDFIVDYLCGQNFVKNLIIYEPLRSRTKLQILFRLLRNNLKYKIRKGRLPDRSNATGVDIFSQNYIYVLFFFRFVRLVKFHLIDEGLSSYTGRVLDPKYRSSLFKALARFKFISGFLPEAVGLYLLHPQFFHKKASFNVQRIQGAFYLDNFDGIKIPTSHLHNTIFLGSDLDSMHNLLVSGEFDKKKYVEFTRYFSRLFPDCIYKRHPSEDRRRCQEYWAGDFLETELPWELLSSRLDPSIFVISIFSTACLTPLLMYKKQIKVVFLYKLLGYDLLNSDDVIEKIQDQYNNLIFIPTTLPELELLIGGNDA